MLKHKRVPNDLLQSLTGDGIGYDPTDPTPAIIEELLKWRTLEGYEDHRVPLAAVQSIMDTPFGEEYEI